MSQLICPRCEDGGDLRWENPDAPRLLEEGIIKCHTCRSRYQGIPGWRRATEKRAEATRDRGNDLMTCVAIFINDHPHGAAGTVNGKWILQNSDGQTVSYGKGMTDAARRYVHLKYGQGPIRRRLP